MLSARSMASCGWTPPVASATLALKSEDTLGLGGTLFLDELADGWKGTLLPQLKTPISIHDI